MFRPYMAGLFVLVLASCQAIGTSPPACEDAAPQAQAGAPAEPAAVPCAGVDSSATGQPALTSMDWRLRIGHRGLGRDGARDAWRVRGQGGPALAAAGTREKCMLHFARPSVEKALPSGEK
ncbi:MAG: hypothetical protein HY812_15330 [Planctomycetes bacterium]|nr:hypothetical protein [Planctomycetota bacterium]